MASQNVKIAGDNWNNVPSLNIPLQTSGTAHFFDVSDTTATASDVASGKYFYTANGTKTAGTASGGGGGGLTLLATKSLGTISTSSTSAADTGQTMTINQSVINGYNAIIFVCSVDTRTNSRHVATVRVCNLSATSNVSTVTGTSMATSTWHCKAGSTGTLSARAGTTAYGVYANAATISNSVMTVTIYQRYNSTSSGTINGSYTMRAYGLKYTDYI